MKKSLLILAIAVMAYSKTDSTSDESQITDEISKAIDESLGESVNEYRGKLDQLLTLEMAANALGYEASEAEYKYDQSVHTPAGNSVSYRWEKGRTMTIKNEMLGDMALPLDDKIELSWLKKDKLKHFNETYKNYTPEERAEQKKVVNEKLKEMEKDGKVTSDQAKTADGLLSVVSKGIAYIEVPNVGDAAIWENKTKELRVHYKGLQFRLTVDTIKGDEADMQIAAEVAKQIIKEKL